MHIAYQYQLKCLKFEGHWQLFVIVFHYLNLYIALLNSISFRNKKFNHLIIVYILKV